ncbi:putative chaperone protein dnaj [Caerostris extrusa]|uniref:Chaperone protein dnaj n=1 Tax=Caerostris extrusa TaxID=172846 RepID=A0AAV4VE93_CAEEX|nr:putative chaperone protein dnaj [Caerostris extrusa]
MGSSQTLLLSTPEKIDNFHSQLACQRSRCTPESCARRGNGHICRLYTMENYYKVLGISTNSSREEIKRSYHNLIREHHPDKSNDQASTHFLLIDEAWKTLSVDNLRKKYDAELLALELQDTHPVQEEINICSTFYNSKLEQYEKDCRCGGKYILSTHEVIKDELLLVDCDNCSLSIVIDCAINGENKNS